MMGRVRDIAAVTSGDLSQLVVAAAEVDPEQAAADETEQPG